MFRFVGNFLRFLREADQKSWWKPNDLDHSRSIETADDSDDFLDDGQNSAVPGLTLLHLLTNPTSWVHRRIESLRLSEQGSTRKRVSQDMTISESGIIQAKSRGRMVVPLGWMPKGPVTRLDASYNGENLIVLGKSEHNEIVVHMLVSSLEELCGTRLLNPKHRKVVEAVLDATTSQEQQRCVEAFERLVEKLAPSNGYSPEQQDNLATVRALVQLLMSHYILFVELDMEMVGLRFTVKYSSDVPAPKNEGTAPIEIQWAIPDFPFAESQHFEIEVPANLQVQRLRAIAFDDADQVTQWEDSKTEEESRSAHVVLRAKKEDVRVDVTVHVQPSAQGLFSFARWSVLICTLLVILSVPLRIFDHQVLGPKVVPSNSVSILLIAPALLISWVSRGQEHSIVIALLRPLRRILLATAGLFVCIAGLAAIPLTAQAWNICWGAIYVATAVLAIYAQRYFTAYRRSAP
ncbi:hypothetical protein [Glutamicibacter mysorens]|uniref:hypothetical protein n=1 Tax=Glutamicibacter mysorens TaxID=257984 RepID=UPI0020C600E0|nr:hypothetical protein [Glutamicibacter mysorens]UTM45823.1 hypothetical protein XH9_09530 [Glutamicibacter mysorens]